MTSVLALLEVSPDGTVPPPSSELAALASDIARQKGEPLRIALLGSVSEQLATLPPECAELYSFKGVEFSPYQTHVLVTAALAAIRESSASIVLAPHTLRTREWMPRLAARLRTGVVTDCVRIEVRDGVLILTKPIHGGSAIAEFVVDGDPALATVRPGVGRELSAAEPSAGDPSPDMRWIEVVPDEVHDVSIVSEEVVDSTDGPSLSKAGIIVSGGRGIGGPENWHFVEELAAAVGGAVGCSRPVTDSGWVPAQLQVGLTGATVSPELYIAVGISGATQHLAGIAGARTVVAINTDPEAAIFRRAQYGVVGDFHEVVPGMINRLREIEASRSTQAPDRRP